MQTGESYLSHISDQVFLVDPRSQGYGLEEHSFLDSYANKFFLLSGRDGYFISPKKISTELTNYYEDIGIDCAPQDNIITIPNVNQGGFSALEASQMKFDGTKNLLVPYMVTPDVEETARQLGLSTLNDSAIVSLLANKANFQEQIALINDKVIDATGLSIAIPHLRLQAGDLRLVGDAYDEMSRGGRQDIIVVRPESASALGLFIVRAMQGKKHAIKTIRENFQSDEELMIEEFFLHKHAPSMQGSRFGQNPYIHEYFGKQFVSIVDGRPAYDASEIPFGSETADISKKGIKRLLNLHGVLGKELIEKNKASGIIGFDLLINTDRDGDVSSARATEINMHLPSSLAIYAAIKKLFPNGMNGIAHNMKVPFKGNRAKSFRDTLGKTLILEKEKYGAFPLNDSYDDELDVVFFAEDEEQLKGLIAILS